jgi:ATP-dependent Clp protease ATP-binding subunit ClpA
MMRFDRFTERAQNAAQRAAEIIERYGHNRIDTVQLLPALFERPAGVTPQILEKLGFKKVPEAKLGAKAVEARAWPT